MIPYRGVFFNYFFSLRRVPGNNSAMRLTSVAGGVFVFVRSTATVFSFVRSTDVKLLLGHLAKVFTVFPHSRVYTGLPHGKVYPAPSGLDNISRKAPEDRPGDDSEASVARSALAPPPSALFEP